MANRRAIALIAPALLAGCAASAPPPSAALPAIPASFDAIPPGWTAAQPADATPRGAWWAMFADPVLDDLEQRAEAASPTLAAAIARRDEARAVLGEAQGQVLPEIDGSAGIARTRVAQDRPLSQGKAATYTDDKLGAQMAWEVDLWGHLRQQVAAARADAGASEADLASARLLLQAAVADAYARLRGLDAEADLLARSVSAYTTALDLTRRRHEGGVASGLDENRALTVLGNARALVADVANQRALAEHEIAALIGATASGFHIAPAAQGLPAPPVPPATPATLIQRRPDIAAAERRVLSANARIGVARAALFPTITLGLAGGYETTGGALLSAPNSTWSLGPIGLSLPLFDGGRRRAGLALARAQAAEAVATYRSGVLTAFREVEDALAAARDLTREAAEQKAAAEAAEATSRLSFVRYREGAADYFEVVTAQTDALNARRALLAVETRRAQASIAIVRALGGPP